MIDGFVVRGWLCPKCKEEYYPADIDQVLVFNKRKKLGLTVKIGRLKDGPYLRFPKELFSIVHKGDIALIKAKSKDEFLLKINHKE